MCAICCRCLCLRPKNRGSVFAFFRFRVASATDWTATVHTLHMPKPVITFVFQVSVHACDTVRHDNVAHVTAQTLRKLRWWKNKDAARPAIASCNKPLLFFSRLTVFDRTCQSGTWEETIQHIAEHVGCCTETWIQIILPKQNTLATADEATRML